jgi:hypothetical protein
MHLHEEFRDIAESLGTAIWFGEARANLAEDLIALGRADEADALLAAAIGGLGDLAFGVTPA